ncbi:MAG: esterase [Gemmatimonadetes bacterium]|nr:esterase [Gemmatimonadota bacterium]
MKISVAFALLLPLALATPAAAQLTIHVTKSPPIPANAAIYVAGGFNGWNPGSASWKMTRLADSTWAITMPSGVTGTVEFKLTVGSWDHVELLANGDQMANRTATVPRTGAETLSVVVARWDTKSGVGTPRKHTASANVHVLSDTFAIPQLGRERRVWLYLPPGYATSKLRYPVLYMHDGQNVFDAATSFAGEWGIDETLDSLHALGDRGVIVVAVDNGETHRMSEYNPWKNANPALMGGEGDRYVDFLAKTLKPYIDAHYRTMPSRENTGVMGSSMGGLISLYAALKYPTVFGRAGVFSSAHWTAPELYSFVKKVKPLTPAPKFYFVVGGKETPDGSMGVQQAALVDTLVASGFLRGSSIEASMPPDGVHSEWFWRREFPRAYLWLFSGGKP